VQQFAKLTRWTGNEAGIVSAGCDCDGAQWSGFKRQLDAERAAVAVRACLIFRERSLGRSDAEVVGLKAFQAHEQADIVEFFAGAVVADFVEFVVENILLRGIDAAA
jgi:hypothetical protein